MQAATPTSPTSNPTSPPSKCLLPTAGQLPLQLSNSYSPKASSASSTSSSAKSSGETPYISDNNNSRSSTDLSNLRPEPQNDADDGDVSPNNNPSSSSSSLPSCRSCPAINAFFNLLKKHLSPLSTDTDSDDITRENIELRRNSINYALENAYSTLISSEQETASTANTINADSVQYIKYILWNIIIQIESIKSNGIKRYYRACNIDDSEVNTLLGTIHVKDKDSFFYVINEKITERIKSLCIRIEKRNVEQASESVAIDINTTDTNISDSQQNEKKTVNTPKLQTQSSTKSNAQPDNPKKKKIPLPVVLILAFIKTLTSAGLSFFGLQKTFNLISGAPANADSLPGWAKIGVIVFNAFACLNTRVRSMLTYTSKSPIDTKNFSPAWKRTFKAGDYLGWITSFGPQFLTGSLGGKVFLELVENYAGVNTGSSLVEIINTIVAFLAGGSASAYAFQAFQAGEIPFTLKEIQERDPINKKKIIAGIVTSLATVSFSFVTFFQLQANFTTLLRLFGSTSTLAITLLSGICLIPNIIVTVLSQGKKTFKLFSNFKETFPEGKSVASTLNHWTKGILFSLYSAMFTGDTITYSVGTLASVFAAGIPITAGTMALAIFIGPIMQGLFSATFTAFPVLKEVKNIDTIAKTIGKIFSTAAYGVTNCFAGCCRSMANYIKKYLSEKKTEKLPLSQATSTSTHIQKNQSPSSSSSSTKPNISTPLLAGAGIPTQRIYSTLDTDLIPSADRSVNGTAEDTITVNMDSYPSSVPAKPSKRCCCPSSSPFSMFSSKNKKTDKNEVKKATKSCHCSIL
jgi:hypothetical protein